MAKAQYCGHATVILTSDKGKRIIIDPWLKGNPACPASLHNPGKIDCIVLTHGHSDHTGSAIELAKSSGAVIFATYELVTLMAKEGIPESQLQPMNKGGAVEAPNSNGIRIRLTNAFHSSSFQASDGHTYYAGEACGALIHLEHTTVYHAGDTCVFGDMKLIGDLYEPDLAFLPIGDRFTMGPEEAALAAEMIRAQTVVPIHYRTFPLIPGDPERLAALVKGEISAVRIIEPGQEIEI